MSTVQSGNDQGKKLEPDINIRGVNEFIESTDIQEVANPIDYFNIYKKKMNELAH